MSDKYKMFKQYMCNELGITKEDIQVWIKETIQEEVKKHVAQTYGKYDPEQVVKTILAANFTDWSRNTLDRTVWEYAGKEIAKRLDIVIK